MKKEKLSESFWTERYNSEETGWNIGYASTPIVDYINQLTDKDIRILIPGAGNAYEAEYLHQEGFGEVYVLDISKTPLDNLSKRYPDFPSDHLIHANFFDHHTENAGKYDLIIEQTFFCALDPALRQSYADQMYRLLKEDGKLAGLWFGFPFNEDQENPPYGGSLEEYKRYFKDFSIEVFEACFNSIEPRQGNELFAIIKKSKK